MIVDFGYIKGEAVKLWIKDNMKISAKHESTTILILGLLTNAISNNEKLLYASFDDVVNLVKKTNEMLQEFNAYWNKSEGERGPN